MDENDPPELPPQPDQPSGARIPTSRREPPLLEEMEGPPEPIPLEEPVLPEDEFEWLAPFHNRIIIHVLEIGYSLDNIIHGGPGILQSPPSLI